jgi:hypothetical protein
MSTVVVDTAVAKPRGERMRTYAKLFDDADQARVRAELSLFFGPRAETFLLTYEKMRSATGSRRLSPRTWCWPVAIGSFTWFFYRKMYAYGAILIFLPLIFAYLFGYVGGSTWLLFASSAKGHYVNSALQRISKADLLGLKGDERSDYLQRAGGVSLPAGIFAGLIYVCLLTLVILVVFAVFVDHHHPGH